MKSLTYILVKPERKKNPSWYIGLKSTSFLAVFRYNTDNSHSGLIYLAHAHSHFERVVWRVVAIARVLTGGCGRVSFLYTQTTTLPSRRNNRFSLTKHTNHSRCHRGFFFKTLSYLFIDFDYKITIIRFRGKEANDNELPIKIFALQAGGMIHAFKSIKWVIYMYICTIGTLSWIDWIFCIYWLLI